MQSRTNRPDNRREGKPVTGHLTSVQSHVVRPHIVRRPQVQPRPTAEPATLVRSVAERAESKELSPSIFHTCFEVLRVLFVPAAAVAVFCGILVIVFGNRFQAETKQLDLVQIELQDPALGEKASDLFNGTAAQDASSSSLLDSIHGSLSSALAEISKPRAVFQQTTPGHDIDDLRSKVKFIAGLIAMHRPSIQNCGEVARAIVEISARENIDPFFVAAVISIESRFANSAVSKVGARGLMQLMPQTAAHVSKSANSRSLVSLNDTKTNISLGVRYLKQLRARYRGDNMTALAAYNWGPGNVDRARKGAARIPGSVRNYASTVIQRSQNWAQHYRKAKDSASDLDSIAMN